jgi:hypothetical protein
MVAGTGHAGRLSSSSIDATGKSPSVSFRRRSQKSPAECRAIARDVRALRAVARVGPQIGGLSREQVVARVEYEGLDRVKAALSGGKRRLFSRGISATGLRGSRTPL